MISCRPGVCLLFFSMIFASPSVQAESPAREGWQAGVSVGFGPGGALNGEGETLSTDDGISAQIRFGKMVSPRLMLGVELDDWVIEEGDLDHKFRRSLQNWSLALTYFPGEIDANGFFLRAGGGIALGGRAKVELTVDPVEGITQEHADRDDEWGWGLILGLGYEHRISDHMAAGLGLNFNYLIIDETWYDTAWFGSATLNLGWYF